MSQTPPPSPPDVLILQGGISRLDTLIPWLNLTGWKRELESDTQGFGWWRHGKVQIRLKLRSDLAAGVWSWSELLLYFGNNSPPLALHPAHPGAAVVAILQAALENAKIASKTETDESGTHEQP